MNCRVVHFSKRLLSLLLSLFIVVSFAIFAYAEEGDSTTTTTVADEQVTELVPAADETSEEDLPSDEQGEEETTTKREPVTPASDYTGIAYHTYKNETAWWRFENGKVQPKANGIYQNEYGWWYVEDGKVNFSHTGVDKNKYGWWRVKDGKVDFSAQGIYKNQNGWWKTTDGKVTFKENGVFKNENGWWKVAGSKVDFTFTGLAKNANGWWYLKNGMVQFDYTGLAQNKNGRWYVHNGGVDFQYDGDAQYKGITYTCTNGKVTGGTNSAETNAVKVLNSVGWDFKKAYYWTINNITYNKTIVPVDGSYGVANYANHGFEQKSGNCYTFSCCVYYLGRMANEDIHVMKGTVPYRSGGRGVHSWDEITRNGKTYVLDAQYEQQWRNQGRQPYSGWLFTYGTKGSLVYAIDHQMI